MAWTDGWTAAQTPHATSMQLQPQSSCHHNSCRHRSMRKAFLCTVAAARLLALLISRAMPVMACHFQMACTGCACSASTTIWECLPTLQCDKLPLRPQLHVAQVSCSAQP